jgi:hypothetical protein
VEYAPLQAIHLAPDSIPTAEVFMQVREVFHLFFDVPLILLLVKWDTSGIAVYFFPANSIPSDITAEAPQPDSWGAAQARWPATSCDPTTFFVNHSAIFDTTLWYVIYTRRLAYFSILNFIQRGLGRWGMECCRYSWARTELRTTHWRLDVSGIRARQRRIHE